MKRAWGLAVCGLAGGLGHVVPGAARADELYVGSFFGGSVLVFDETGAFVREATVGGPLLFAGAAVHDPDGNLLVNDDGRGEVQKYDGTTGRFISVLIPTLTGGLESASCLLLGDDGRLYASNYTSPGNVLRFNARTGAFVGVFATSPTFSRGSDMVFHNGSLYVCSDGSNEVLRFHATTGAFQGVFCSAGLNFPRGLDFGPDGHLYVSSAFGNDVRKFNGTTGAPMGVFIGPAGGLASPHDIDFGPDGHLYVCDFARDRVARFHGVTGLYLDDFASGHGLDAPQQMFFKPEGCYPDCDTSTGRGNLDIFDFLCFQNRYDNRDPYACDCDQSTGPRICDIFDFLCFQNAYDLGCP